MSQAIDNDPRSELIFSWLRKDGRVIKLSVFIALSFAVHAFAFYLFQVVYAGSGRIEPAPAGITFLDPENPEVRIMIREIEDRLVFQRSPSQIAGSRVSLSDYAVSFEPTFPTREPGFKKPPPPELIGKIQPLVILPPEKKEEENEEPTE